MTSRADIHFSREERTDPITGKTLKNTEDKCWIQEGDPDEGLIIYFENEVSIHQYLDIEIEHPEQGLSHTLSNDINEAWDEG